MSEFFQTIILIYLGIGCFLAAITKSRGILADLFFIFFWGIQAIIDNKNEKKGN